jgi:hypothetical protein
MSFLNANSSAFFTVSKSNSSYFPDSGSNDLIIGIQDNTQNILFGIESNTSILKISNSNVTIGGSLITEMIAVSGQIIGTGTNVVFSPISTGFGLTNPTDLSMGIGLGPQRVQIQNSFIQWPNSTTMPVLESQSYNSNTANILFQYDNILDASNNSNNPVPEQTFSQTTISITGKQISQDFVLSNGKNKFYLTAPSGMFSLGFDSINTLNKEYDETIVFRCYYNKKTQQDNIPQGYYYIKGSQFINAMFPKYSRIYLIYDPIDNPSKSFTLDGSQYSSTKFRITRLSVIE